MYSNFNDIDINIDVLSDEHLDSFSDFLQHYGTPHVGNIPHSGRYPYDPYKDFKDTVTKLRKEGFTNKEIAEKLNIESSSVLVRKYAIANAEVRAANRARAMRMWDHGDGYTEIGKKMGMNESSVRSLLNDVYNERSSKIRNVANILEDEVKKSPYGFIDVGLGVSNRLGVSNDKLKTSLQLLMDEGKYKVYNEIPIKQVATGNTTWAYVLAKSELSKKDVKSLIKNNEDALVPPQYCSENGEIKKLEKPVSVDSSRIFVRYGDNHGAEKDGLIELRRGVEDISLKNAHYAQVRIAVDGTHYLKGMAMYGQDKDIPEGYDIVFNTNKKSGTPKIDPTGGDNEVFKKLKDSSKNIDGNPFGASIKLDNELVLAQRHYIGKDGKEHLSALNIVSEEGNWEKWSKNLASQFLSKQPVPLAKKQLDIAYLDKKQDFDNIMKLTNPVVKRKLLEEFADNCDSAAVHLKAAAMPRQQTHVILPFPEMKDTEIYAPNYKDGTKVVLIRYPHGGKFELPELTVNNKVPSVKKALGGDIKDAVGINSKVAERLSGADFDGDTVVVIPNNRGAIKTQSPLAKLKDFDPKESYPYYEGMKVMTEAQKGREMGIVSNLITDMTLKGAPDDKIARAVRHSMVVIDAVKHKLNWKQSEKDNAIAALKKEYQEQENGKFGGASTIISRAKSEEYIPDRKIQFSLYQYTDKNGNVKTSEKKPEGKDISNVKKIVDKGIYIETGEKAYKNSNVKVSKLKNDGTWEQTERKMKTTKMANAKDARELMSSISSPYPMEVIYAEYANRMKALANNARKEYIATPLQQSNKTARTVYADAVKSLNIQLNNALMNKPLERKAHALAQVLIKEARRDNPDMDGDDKKKLSNDMLRIARTRVGANKKKIEISDYEWKAIQAGAVTDNKLKQILDNTDMDRVRKLATPKREIGLSSTEKALAKSMLNSGFTRSDVADRLGVSPSTLSKYLSD